MTARILTALAHGTFFGVGSIVATNLVADDRKASAIARMFAGLTVANLVGVPIGTLIGQHLGWRATFWAVTLAGFVAFIAIAGLVPNSVQQEEAADWHQDLRAVLRAPVLLALATTILGYAGVFAVLTCIAPILVGVARFPKTVVSPILLVFGGGLVVGNIIGGKLADHALAPALFGTLAALALVLASMTAGLSSPALTVLLSGLLGATGFATVAPLQMSVLSKTDAGRDLASSLNIAAFNIGNAIGAWTGGIVIDRGPGLAFVPLIAALFPVAAIGVAAIAAIGPSSLSANPLLSRAGSKPNGN